MKRTKIKRIATSIMTFVCLQNTNIKMNQEIYHTNNGINTNKAIVLVIIFEYNYTKHAIVLDKFTFF